MAPNESGATNFRPPSFDPQTGLFIVSAQDGYGIYFFKPEHGAYGWAGADYGVAGRAFLRAIDYKTGKIVWNHPDRRWRRHGRRAHDRNRRDIQRRRCRQCTGPADPATAQRYGSKPSGRSEMAQSLMSWTADNICWWAEAASLYAFALPSAACAARNPRFAPDPSNAPRWRKRRSVSQMAADHAGASQGTGGDRPVPGGCRNSASRRRRLQPRSSPISASTPSWCGIMTRPTSAGRRS